MPFPFRADHVGSLLRPAELLDARRSHISPDEIHALEDRQILRIL
jgi:methionine synthase II (cobalamin-independent)